MPEIRTVIIMELRTDFSAPLAALRPFYWVGMHKEGVPLSAVSYGRWVWLMLRWNLAFINIIYWTRLQESDFLTNQSGVSCEYKSLKVFIIQLQVLSRRAFFSSCLPCPQCASAFRDADSITIQSTVANSMMTRRTAYIFSHFHDHAMEYKKVRTLEQ